PSASLPPLHPFPARRSSDLPGRDRAGRETRRTRSVDREGAAHGDGERGDISRAAGGEDGDRAPRRDQVPGLLSRVARLGGDEREDRKSTRLNSSHGSISYAV